MFLGSASRSFSDAVKLFAKGLKCPAHLYNVTSGENLFLNARASNGQFLLDEGILVENPNRLKIEQVFFSRSELKSTAEATKAIQLDVRPKVCESVIDCIRSADLIVYSPGTQFSSLIPSYMTDGLIDKIASSGASKYLLVNLDKDRDMLGYSSSDIIVKILSYLKIDDNITSTVDKIMVDPSVEDVDRSKLSTEAAERIHYETHSLDGNRHDRDVAVSSVMNQYYTSIGKMNRHLGFCSVIVPTLNEGERLSKTLSAIADNLDLLTKTRRLEVIVVDGANDQNVRAEVKMFGDTFRYVGGSNRRGESFRAGIDSANGDLICVFPGDFEFEIEDLLEMIRYSEIGAYDVVLGSRSQNLSRLNELNLGRGFISRFGGVLVALLLYTLHSFHVRDILTTIRVYKSTSLSKLKFACRGVDFDVEVPLRAFKAGMRVCEIPVSYNARGYTDGKKITLRDGLQILWFTIISSLRKRY